MSRSNLYSLIHGILDDVDLHIKTALGYANREDAEKAVVRCERAIKSLDDAQEEIENNKEEISHQKMAHFNSLIIGYRQKIWQATRQINDLAKTNFALHKRSKSLRLNLLAYSYDPPKNLENHYETSQAT